MTFTDFGATVGLLTGVLTVLDRLVFGRPIATVSIGEYRTRFLRFQNVSKYDVFLKRVLTYPSRIAVAADDSEKGVILAALGSKFGALIGAGATRDFPIVVKDGTLLDSDNEKRAPFAIVVTWRKTRSMWLPQFPIVIFSSARTLRMLHSGE